MDRKIEREIEHERSTDPAWWTWLEAVEWVAFRGAEPPLPWPPGWVWRNLDSATLAAVAARADTSLRREERTWRPKREDWYGRSYEQRARVKWWLRALQAAGVSAADLPACTRELAEAARERDAAKAAACSDLMAAVRSERLPILGQRPLPDARGNSTRAPAGQHAPIPFEVFADPGLVVEADAVTVPVGSSRWWQEYNCWPAPGEPRTRYPLYITVRFRVRDVRRLWPASPPPRRTTLKHIRTDVLEQRIREWMAAERKAGREPARERCVPELRKLLGCSRDALNTAYSVVCRADGIGPGRRPAKSAG